jgi:hypothetical protein
MRGLVIVSRGDHGVPKDGSAGVSPEGWLPDRVLVGALTRTFPPELVDRVVQVTHTREARCRLLPVVTGPVGGVRAPRGASLYSRLSRDCAPGHAARSVRERRA